MIYTITLNVSLDKIVTLPHLKVNTDNSALDIFFDIGGKATHVSMVLSAVGVPNVATGFMAGYTGEMVNNMLKDAGVDCQYIWVDGKITRETTLIRIAGEEGSYMITERGFEVPREYLDKLFDKLNNELKEGDMVVISGGPPKGVEKPEYEELYSLIKSKGAKLIVDIGKGYLPYAVDAKPFLIKPNQKELEDYLGRQLNGEEEVIEEMLKLNDNGVEYVIVSLGSQGSLMSHNGEVFKAVPPKVFERNDTGCGDVFLGGVVSQIYLNKPVEEIFRFATGLGASKATKEGSSEFSLEEAAEYAKQVIFEKVR